MKTKKTGFTLVELLVVISIIALLLAVLVPAMKRAKDISKRVICSSQLKQIGVGIIAYANSCDNQLPADYVLDESGQKKKEGHPYVLYKYKDGEPYWTKQRTSDGKIKSWPLRLAWLYEKKYIGDARVFYCAGNVDRLYRYESYINPGPWGTLPQEGNYRMPRGYAGATSDENQWVRSGYTYFPTDPKGKTYNDSFANVGTSTVHIYAPKEAAEKFDRLDNALPYMTDSINSRSGLAHKSGIKEISGSGTTKVELINAGINALFKDGHVIYATDKKIFTDSRWELWGDAENSSIPRQIQPSEYPKFYYRIFVLIAGNRGNLSEDSGGRD